MEQSVSLISVTKPLITLDDDKEMSPEGLIAYCARVSSPNQENPEYEKLLRYCMKHGHWSIFEMADMTVEIVTSRAIAPQILRHRSFSFQEFSQRYAKAQDFINHKPRRQDAKNRQNSFDDLPQETLEWWAHVQAAFNCDAQTAYEEALKRGIAKECARFLLPMNTATRLYMKGSARSWIHYLKVRQDKATQLEHRHIADQIWLIFKEQFPVIARAMMPDPEVVKEKEKKASMFKRMFRENMGLS